MVMFKANVGTVDRVVRVAVGLVLVSLVFVGPQSAWGWIGLLPLFTATVRLCPGYWSFGLSTCGRDGHSG